MILLKLTEQCLVCQMEIKARLAAESKLQEAERSLGSLERAVADKNNKLQADVKEEMTVNVQKLKSKLFPLL